MKKIIKALLRFSLNQKGFSLTEVMVSAAVIGIVSSGVMVALKMTGDSGHNRKKTEIIDSLHKQIITDLKNNTTCAATFGAGPSPSTILGFAVSNPAPQITVPQYQGIGIQSVQLSGYTAAAGVQKANLVVVYTKNPIGTNKQAVGSPTIIKQSVVSLKVSGGAIVECSAGFLEDENLEEACKKAGGNWDITQPIASRCDVDASTETVDKCGNMAFSNSQGAQLGGHTGECDADLAYCYDTGGCWENGKCETPKFGEWMLVGAPDCISGGCAYGITYKCIGATCGKGCQGAQPAPQVTQANRPECGTPGTWVNDTPFCATCQYKNSHVCQPGTCGMGCLTAQPADDLIEACRTTCPGCGDNTWPSPTFSGICTSGCSETASISCSPGSCQTTCSGLPSGCAASGTSATCTDSSCTTPGSWTLGAGSCTGSCNQSVQSYTCTQGCNSGACPGSKPADLINASDATCTTGCTAPTCEDLAGSSCSTGAECGTGGECITSGPASPPPPTIAVFGKCCSLLNGGNLSLCKADSDCPGEANTCSEANCEQAPSSSSSSGGCFVTGTQIILESGKTKDISQLEVGDKVLGSNGKINQVEKLIKKSYEGFMYSINGSGYFVTDDHPFMLKDGHWASFNPEKSRSLHGDLVEKKLEANKQVVGIDGLRTLRQIMFKWRKTKVYNMTVNGSHDYYADGFLVHNKCEIPACGTDERINCGPCGYQNGTGLNSCKCVDNNGVVQSSMKCISATTLTQANCD